MSCMAVVGGGLPTLGCVVGWKSFCCTSPRLLCRLAVFCRYFYWLCKWVGLVSGTGWWDRRTNERGRNGSRRGMGLHRRYALLARRCFRGDRTKASYCFLRAAERQRDCRGQQHSVHLMCLLPLSCLFCVWAIAPCSLVFARGFFLCFSFCVMLSFSWGKIGRGAPSRGAVRKYQKLDRNSEGLDDGGGGGGGGVRGVRLCSALCPPSLPPPHLVTQTVLR